MARLPILFVDHASALGGAERSLLLLLRHLDRSRWELHLAGVDGPLLEAAAELDLSTHIVSLPRLKRSARVAADWRSGSRQLAELANSLGARLIYSNTIRATLYAAESGRIGRIPLIWHMRDFWLSEGQPSHPWLDHWGKRWLIRRSRRVIVNSAAVKRGLPYDSRIDVIYNGLELSQFDPDLDGHPFRQTFDIPGDVPLVGMVGRLRPWKGQHRFLEMAAAIRRQHPGVHFLIVGGTPFGVDDQYPSELRQHASWLGLDGHLTFTGQLSDVRPALSAMSIFVHPGDPEPFGLVNIEAMAMRLPVVGLRHGALPEIVTDDETGRLVEPATPEGLATAVAKLLGDPQIADRMGVAGRQRVVDAFTIERTAGAVEAVLRKLVDGN